MNLVGDHQREISYFLVRYGRLGRVGWFGTVHVSVSTAVGRGDEVVVDTSEGRWLGTILRAADDGQTPQACGELMDLANDDQRQTNRERQLQTAGLVEAAKQCLNRHHVAATMLDVDISLDGATAILQYAGRGGASLGPMAVELAREEGIGRVQWLSVEDSTLVELHDMREDERQGTEVQTDSSLVGTKRAVEDRNRSLVRLLALMPRVAEGDKGAEDEASLGNGLYPLARQHRDDLGLAGLYLQKIREPNAKGVTALDRRWMVRVKATAGQLTPGQFRGLLSLAGKYGDGSLRLTMRQGIQFHGVAVGSPIDVLSALDQLAMTGRGSCSNTVRNVCCCALAPESSPDGELAFTAKQLASRIASRWLPRAAWLDCGWLDLDLTDADSGDPLFASRDVAYASGYLPHKWKIGVATADDNCVNVRSNDVGLVVRRDAKGLLCVDCFVGGSLAYRPGHVASAARLAEPLGRIAVEQVEALLTSLMGLHREVADGSQVRDQADIGAASAKETKQRGKSRHFQRLKYVVQRLGTERMADWIKEDTRGSIVLDPHSVEPVENWLPHAAWRRRNDGLLDAVVGIEGGRIRIDESTAAGWLELLRSLEASGQRGRLAIGPRHTLVFSGLSDAGMRRLGELAEGPLAGTIELGLGTLELGALGLGGMRVLSCVGLPTCPLAVEESERKLRDWREAVVLVKSELARLCDAQPNRELSVAVSGCANGCSHPASADLGLVAEGRGVFRVFIGGNGNQLGISVGTVDGPDSLLVLVRRLASEAAKGRPANQSTRNWLRNRAVSGNFAWPETEN